MSADVIPWRRRRTARWMALSLAARGAVEGIVAAMDERRELRLGPTGLRALEGLLGRPWAEVEPAVLEALRSGKLVHDEARNVIVDASREDGDRDTNPLNALEAVEAVRAELVATRAELEHVRSVRPNASGEHVRLLSQTPAAIRSRAWRARRKALAAAATVDDRQVGLPFADTVRANAREPNANAANAFASRTPDDLGRSCVFADVRTNAPSLSEISISSPKSQRGAARIALDTDAMPPGWLDHARTLRPDLPEAIVLRSWRRFALGKTMTFTAWPVAQSRWEGWIERERVASPTGGKPEPSPASSPGSAPNAAQTEALHRALEREERAVAALPREVLAGLARGPLAALGALERGHGAPRASGAVL